MSETKIIVDKDLLIKISIPGYQFISQPTISNAGGVGFYVRDNIEFHSRDDLGSTTEDYDCLWFEVHSKFRNIVCSLVSRYPHSNLDKFINYFTAALDKISKESELFI